MKLASVRGTREVPVEEFITGHYSTQLRDDELLTEVLVPRPPTRATYLQVSQPLERGPSLCGGGGGGRPRLLRDACDLARGRRLDAALAAHIGRAYAEGVKTLSDVRGSPPTGAAGSPSWSDLPALGCEFIETGESHGLGEMAVPVVPAAIGNAVASLGYPARDLPLTPESLLRAREEPA